MSRINWLAGRYLQVARKAWQGRQRQAECYDRQQAFLPAALALQQAPPHPLPGLLQGALLIGAVTTLLWACFGKIDVVASASGKVVPSGRSKVIQASELGRVKAINVEDGQAVRMGDVLIQLDDQGTQADINRLNVDLLAARTDSARARAMLGAIASGKAPESVARWIDHASTQQLKAAQRWVVGQYLEMRAHLEQARAEITQLESEIRAARVAVASLLELLPLTTRVAQDYQELEQIRAVPRHAYLEKEQLRLGQVRDLAVQRLRINELSAALAAAQSRHASVLAQARREMLDLLNESVQRADALAQELGKAERRHRLRQLRAPVDGVVQQLAVHTLGGVVTEAQALMIIVPEQQPVEVEALLENKDVGFVRKGQPVELKIETFNFTRYGVVHGQVMSVSGDAIDDERRGLVYSARIRLDQSSVRVGDEELVLSPGMAVQAEVKTDRRSVISYFLSPLQQYTGESLRER
ncbi:HlyD family type I secretion periplasmic adaptor subunit [Pseudomonas sp. nanlin1]|uniref:HlyD family type I secretion periplasmic adaptor subunit n=1 Tax=Pseudomonas sp. nanlin1 TaxID=3040605 RepID=UPI003890A243